MHNIKTVLRAFYTGYIKPKARDEDQARREYIFNILIVGFLALTLSAFTISLLRQISNGTSGTNIPPTVLIIPVLLLLALYVGSRRGFNNKIAYTFIGIYIFLGTVGLYLYSLALPHGLLIYALVIIVSGILISSRAAFHLTLLLIAFLLTMAWGQTHNIIQPYTNGLTRPFQLSDVVVYIFIFAVICAVSWLSSREIEASLNRARVSEEQLRAERNLLEIKVKERTRELEAAQVEKTRELYRFAEFGRMSASLLHDLANPLTAVSLNFGQLENGNNTDTMNYVRDGITHMEQYVQSARRQLRSQGDVREFDSKEEILKVVSFLASKAKHHKVKLECDLASGAKLKGDITKFSQVTSNLIANAIDAYSGLSMSKGRVVRVNTKVNKAGDTLTLSVSDEGVGIAKKDLERIFDPFFSTKSSDRGTGIGLTITKRIVEEDFKGKLYVDSTKQEGTSFTVVLALHRKR